MWLFGKMQKRRWGSCWSIYSCFRSHKPNKRIGHAVLSPETTGPGAAVPAAENRPQAPALVLPFVAPPSSPASFLHSDPSSCTQSPAVSLSISANMYSPGPTSIFAIGPYAHETQLVSPPVFSTYTTEPSTAPFTPPPESVQLTTPSSPEVPFARLLDPNHQNRASSQRFHLSHHEFQSYLYSGSPVGQLISPSSGISNSGTSSPFPDLEFTPGRPEFQIGDPPKLSARGWRSEQGSGSMTPDAVGDGYLLDRQKSDIAPLSNTFNGWRNAEAIVDHRISFEVTAEDVVRCLAKVPSVARPVSPYLEIFAEMDEPVDLGAHPGEISDNANEKASGNAEEGQQPQRHRSITLGSVKEFNFDNADRGNSDNPTIGSNWWANEKVIGNEHEPSKDWAFFPMIQSGQV